MYTVETCILFRDADTGMMELSILQREFESKEEALDQAERFNKYHAPPERATVRTLKHGLWLRVV